MTKWKRRRGKWTYGEELCESAEQKAERLVKTALRQRGWKETTWRNGAREDPLKIKIALQLRKQSVMTMEWIAQRLQMGTRTYLNHLLYGHGGGSVRTSVHKLLTDRFPFRVRAR